MTKQHLVAFASEIRNRFSLAYEPSQNEKLQADGAITAVCNVARQFNPKFDEARFREACFAK